MTGFVLDFHLWQIDEFIQLDLSVSIHIEGVECRVKYVKGELVIGFDEFEVIAKLFPCDFTIIILIVCKFEKSLKVGKTDFRSSKGKESENKQQKHVDFDYFTFLHSR